jgi:hypothetical protein
MYEAHLSDPACGEATERGATAEEAAAKAFCKLMSVVGGELEEPYENLPLEIRGNEVWYDNRLWSLIGTVEKIASPPKELENPFECQINLCLTSQDDDLDEFADDVVFDLTIERDDGAVRKALLIAANAAMEALRKEGIEATGLTT